MHKRASSRNINVAQATKLILKQVLATNILVLSFAVPVTAGPLEDSRAAYEHGDFATAMRLFRSLAEHGNAIAQYNLGVMYYKGEGVSQSYPLAASWYRLAAWQGDASAQLGLGVLCYNGQGTLQSYTEALTWFRQAADQGSVQAQINLGAMYANGQGAPQDYIQAHMWLSLAAAKSETRAVELRNAVAAKMTAAQIAESQKLAREWKPTKQPPPR
jgi:TPR repeat protein